MTTPSIDDLLSRINNRFLLANVLGHRTKEILDGSLPYIDASELSNPILTAMEELSVGKIKGVKRDAPSEKDLRSADIKEFWPASPSLEKETKKKAKKTKASASKK